MARWAPPGDPTYYEAVLADLRMLASVGKNDNIYTGQGTFQIATASALNGLVRRYLGEARLSNVERIKERVEDAFEVLRDCLRVEEAARAMRETPTREQFDDILRNRQCLARFKVALRESAAGIETLSRSTYVADSRTRVMLDIQAQNIALTLERTEETEARLPPAPASTAEKAARRDPAEPLAR
jgi:hypothetical protein